MSLSGAMSSLCTDFRNPRRALPAPLLLAVLLLSLNPGPLRADELVWTPALAVQEAYNDNISLASGAGSGDFISTVSPSLALSDKAERHDASLAAGMDWLDYPRHSANNSIDYQLQGSGNYLAGPRLSFSGGAGYHKNSLLGTLDPASRLATNAVVGSQNYRAGGKYLITESLSAALDYQRSLDDYQSAGLLDTTVQQGSAQLNLDLSRIRPNTTLVPRLAFRRDETDVSRVDDLSGSLGVMADLSELWHLNLSAGGQGTRSRFETLSPTGSELGFGSSQSLGWLGNLSLSYGGEKISGALNLVRDLTTASGRSGATQQSGGSLSLAERFCRKFSGRLDGGYSFNKAKPDQFSAIGINEVSRNLTALLHYDLSDDLALEGSYRNTRIDYHEFGTRANQNIIMLRLAWQHPMFVK